MLAIETETTRPAVVRRRNRLRGGARSSARVIERRFRQRHVQAVAHRIARALAEIADGLRRAD